MSGSWIVVNADDLGWSEAVNAGIFQAHDQGVLTSASILANGAALAQAAAGAARRPGLGLGVHLNLTTGSPLSPLDRIPGLVGADGRFLGSPGRVARRLLARRLDRRQVQDEADAQVRAILAAGLRPDHLDSHFHVHMLPGLAAWVAEVAAAHEIPWLRVTREHWDPRQLAKPANLAKCALMTGLAQGARRAAARTGLRTAPRVWGLLGSGAMDEARVCAAVEAASHAPGEAISHPALPAEGAPARGDPHERFAADPGRQVELAALTSLKVREELTRRGVRVVRFAELD